MKAFSFSAALLTITCFAAAQGDAPLASIDSPDGKLSCQVLLEGGQPHWAVAYQGEAVLLPSSLGFALRSDSEYCAGLRLLSLEERREDSTWKPVYGERECIRDHFHETTLTFAKGAEEKAHLLLTFRAYNEGVALRYTLPESAPVSSFNLKAEHTAFRFTADHRAWPVYAAQGVYEKTVLSGVKENCERPLTIEMEAGPALAIAEAALVDYARMRLRPAEGSPFTLESHLSGDVRGTAPFTTPWRVLMVADSPGKLLEQNYLIENLNAPCAIEDTSWIQPGKVIREVTLTTEGGKACIDFAVQQNIQYVEFDAGWYGHEYDEKADARTVTVDPKRSKGPLDLQAVIDYGKARGIGILLYVNRRHLERQIDELLPLYQQWGIKGLKYGFVQVGAQRWTAWLHEAIRKAADHKMLVDVHDEYRPTGFSRTYPNFMTQEGIRGNEEMPPAWHNAILPFTRYLCGAGDYTICWYCDRVKNTLAHQLAASVCFYSPLQFVYWYDRPAAYQGDPGTQFLKEVPVTWDELRVLHDAIGDYATLARRKGEVWFVGCLNAREQRSLEIPLDFLTPGKSWEATLYADGAPDGSARTALEVSNRTVNSSDTIHAAMAANGGIAIKLTPQ